MEPQDFASLEHFVTGKLGFESLPRRQFSDVKPWKPEFGLILYAIVKDTLLMSGFSKMEKIAEGVSDFGDFEAVLFRASDGRHFVRIVAFRWLGKASY